MLKELSQSFHLTYSLSPFLSITFSSLNSFCYAFGNSFLQNVPTISSLLKSPITYVNGTVFLTFLITKTSSDQFGRESFGKMF